MGDSVKANLQDRIKEQGDVVRQLKAQKAAKEEVITRPRLALLGLSKASILHHAVVFYGVISL